MNILIVKMSAIGDVIHTLPALNALRDHFPEARITWLVEEAAADLVIGHPSVDNVIVSKRKRWIRSLFSSSFPSALIKILSFIRALRETEYDMIIDFQGLLKSGVMVMLARGKKRIGFDKGMEHAECSHLFYNHRIAPVSMEIHALKRGLMMIQALGVKADKVEYRLPVTPGARAAVHTLLKKNGIPAKEKFICINPQATWETKLWDNGKFADLSDRIQEQYGARIVFTGGPEDRPVIDTIISMTNKTCVNLAGLTTLKMLAALYEQADVLVTTDTGPMHLGAAAGTRVVAIFGSTAPWRTGPYGSDHVVVRSAGRCSPCFNRECEHRTCMHDISVDQVMSAVNKQMGVMP
ncbi:lipopolysaccharide heptosyltransferase I [Desulfobacter curvatus]|uniref:lipopolysaccharide heptosyltransferase I n=1 Tax=Desulfobacter curvatus TaxID=2290 RepID=UPI00037A833C|nr:lipopolysaccharide heptosyltransferase I [Desulfobacter curvatus]